MKKTVKSLGRNQRPKNVSTTLVRKEIDELSFARVATGIVADPFSSTKGSIQIQLAPKLVLFQTPIPWSKFSNSKNNFVNKSFQRSSKSVSCNSVLHLQMLIGFLYFMAIFPVFLVKFAFVKIFLFSTQPPPPNMANSQTQGI